jgi:Mg2+/citrate symporter
LETPSVSPKKAPMATWLLVGLWLAAIGSVAGLSFMVGRAAQMVRTGRGLETYRPFWLALCACIVVVLVLAVVLLVRERQRGRSQESPNARPK